MKNNILIVACLLIVSNIFAVNVTVSPKVKKSVSGLSTLDRGKFFNVHSRSTDAEMTAFYNDYNVSLHGRQFWGPGAVGVQKTGATGTYPGFWNPKNRVQPSQIMVATEHPNSIFKRNLNTSDLADWVVEYYSNWGNSVPLYYEPMNEPFVHASDYLTGGWNSAIINQIKVEMSEVYRDIGNAVHQSPYLTNMKVIGFASAYPQLEAYNFGLWNTDWKMFIDVAGADVDAYAIHLYDGINVTGTGGRRVGSNNKAILDMIDAYSYIKTGTTKPFVIDEYGGIESGYTDAQFNIAAGQAVRSQMSMLFQFLDRPDRVEYSIPFSCDKSLWHINANNNYRPYGATLLIDKQYEQTQVGRPKDQVTEWVYTDRVYFYEMWKDVTGDRVEITTGNPDIFSLAFVDGNKLYIALNNVDDTPQNVNLSMIGNLPSLQSVSVKSLQINPAARASFWQANIGSLPQNVTINYGQTLMYECTFASPVVANSFLNHEFYYANNYFTPINSGADINFAFNNVQLGNSGVATLSIGMGRDIALSKQPILTVNGTQVAVPTTWKGYDQADKAVFFGAIEVEIPFNLLVNGQNDVKLKFNDAGGYVTSLILNVGTRSSTALSSTPIATGKETEDPLKSQKLQVFPNPSEGMITLSNVEKGSTVNIYSLTGQLLHSTNYQGTFTIDIENGMYLLEVNGQTERLQIK